MDKSFQKLGHLQLRCLKFYAELNGSLHTFDSDTLSVIKSLAKRKLMTYSLHGMTGKATKLLLDNKHIIDKLYDSNQRCQLPSIYI